MVAYCNIREKISPLIKFNPFRHLNKSLILFPTFIQLKFSFLFRANWINTGCGMVVESVQSEIKSDPTHETVTVFLYNSMKTATHSLGFPAWVSPTQTNGVLLQSLARSQGIPGGNTLFRQHRCNVAARYCLNIAFWFQNHTLCNITAMFVTTFDYKF